MRGIAPSLHVMYMRNTYTIIVIHMYTCTVGVHVSTLHYRCFRYERYLQPIFDIQLCVHTQSQVTTSHELGEIIPVLPSLSVCGTSLWYYIVHVYIHVHGSFTIIILCYIAVYSAVNGRSDTDHCLHHTLACDIFHPLKKLATLTFHSD